MNDLSERVVMISGASRGIGKAIALTFAEQKCRLVLLARSEKHLAETKENCKSTGAEVLSLPTDVSDEAAVMKAITEARATFGKIDVLINNAGIYKTAPVAGHQSSVWHEIINTNLNSAFYFCRELAADMASRGWGRIINISSISGKHAEMNGAAYSASKFGLIGLTQALALELANKGVTANAICPGWVNTEMARHQLSDPEWCRLNSIDIEESLDIARLSIPQMRFIEPEEVARLALFLCGESARGITGQAINICGGMCLS